MVMAVTVIAVQFKDMGLSLATVQQKEITNEQVSTLFWINLIVGSIITLILCVCSRLVGWFYADQRLVWITMAIATTFFWSGITVQHQALLRRRMEYLKISVINVVANMCSILVAIVLAVKGYGYWALVLREVTVSIFVAIGIWVACPWIPGLPKKNTGIGRMVRFGGDVTGFNIVTYFTDSLDQILLGKFYGANLLGIYRQAYQLIMVPIAQINNPVQLVGQSSLSCTARQGSQIPSLLHQNTDALELRHDAPRGLLICARKGRDFVGIGPEMGRGCRDIQDFCVCGLHKAGFEHHGAGDDRLWKE